MPHSGNADFLGIFGWYCLGTHKAATEKSVVGSIHEFCHFLSSLGWNMETDREKVYAGKQRRCTLVWWCRTERVGCKANANTCVSVYVCVRVLCPHRGHVYCLALKMGSTWHCVHISMASLPPWSCSLMSLSTGVYNLKAENREETAGGLMFNLFSRAARGKASGCPGRGVWEGRPPAGKPGQRGAHVRERPVPACHSAPPHVRPRGTGGTWRPPEHSALSPAPCISCWL